MKGGLAYCVTLAMLATCSCGDVVAENCSSLIQARTNVTKAQATGLDKWKISVEAFVDADFKDFTLQCSHNTYTYGTQNGNLGESQSTHENAMISALRLGYRCIEIDVWPRNNPKKMIDDWFNKRQGKYEGFWTGPGNSKYPYPGNMKVLHQVYVKPVWKEMTNSVDTSLFVYAILKWCEDDEKAAHTQYPKMPIVISVENRACEWGSNSECSAREKYLENVFHWFGERLVIPAKFRPVTKLSSLMVKNGKRKIIIKSKLAKEGNANYQNIVAMRNDNEKRKDLEGTYRSMSIDMATGRNPLSPSNKQKIVEALGKGSLVRTYPNAMEMKSDNYPPGELFELGVQMVCINYQGRCQTKEDMCPDPIHMQLPGKKDKGCACSRNYAANMEKVFNDWGFDGYLPTKTHPKYKEFENEGGTKALHDIKEN